MNLFDCRDEPGNERGDVVLWPGLAWVTQLVRRRVKFNVIHTHTRSSSLYATRLDVHTSARSIMSESTRYSPLAALPGIRENSIFLALSNNSILCKVSVKSNHYSQWELFIGSGFILRQFTLTQCYWDSEIKLGLALHAA